MCMTCLHYDLTPLCGKGTSRWLRVCLNASKRTDVHYALLCVYAIFTSCCSSPEEFNGLWATEHTSVGHHRLVPVGARACLPSICVRTLTKITHAHACQASCTHTWHTYPATFLVSRRCAACREGTAPIACARRSACMYVCVCVCVCVCV